MTYAEGYVLAVQNDVHGLHYLTHSRRGRAAWSHRINHARIYPTRGMASAARLSRNIPFVDRGKVVIVKVGITLSEE